ncbi:hypothetical protein Tco_0615002 [Tanacetum coccineum]
MMQNKFLNVCIPLSVNAITSVIRAFLLGEVLERVIRKREDEELPLFSFGVVIGRRRVIDKRMKKVSWRHRLRGKEGWCMLRVEQDDGRDSIVATVEGKKERQSTLLLLSQWYVLNTYGRSLPTNLSMVDNGCPVPKDVADRGCFIQESLKVQ